MTRPARVALALYLATVGGLLVLAGPGQAGVETYPSTITLRVTQEGQDTVFRGRVRSPKPACERNRRVRITGGNDSVGTPATEGETTTDELGRYELSVPTALNNIGNYRAIALRKERPRYICKRAVSEVVNEFAAR
ncbi:MAG: hypothetical protein ACR2G3_01090 [Solirubrobacterales bacterium]